MSASSPLVGEGQDGGKAAARRPLPESTPAQGRMIVEAAGLETPARHRALALEFQEILPSTLDKEKGAV